MNATRYQVSSTSEYLSALLTQIGNGVSDVRLFATHKDETKGGFDPASSGPSVNLPLVAALVYDSRRWIVYDGNLLNAVRDPRIAEVKALLDAAVEDGKVLYGTRPVDFTAGMTAEEAARYLKEVETEQLTNETRKCYASMLSGSANI